LDLPEIAMTHYRTLVSSAVLASSLGFIAAPAIAMPPDCVAQEARGPFPEYRGERLEQHHKSLLAILKLTPAQEPAWKKLLEAERPQPRLDPAKAEDLAKLTMPERADKMLELMKEQQLQLTQHAAALKEFYATLTPEQKKGFDGYHAGLLDGKRRPQMPHPLAPEKAAPKP
jgi:Spy/CpxP family protein refolding chaperone